MPSLHLVPGCVSKLVQRYAPTWLIRDPIPIVILETFTAIAASFGIFAGLAYASCSVSCLRQYVNSCQQLPRLPLKSVTSTSRPGVHVSDAPTRVCIGATRSHSHGASDTCKAPAQSTEDEATDEIRSRYDPSDSLASDEQLSGVSIAASANLILSPSRKIHVHDSRWSVMIWLEIIRGCLQDTELSIGHLSIGRLRLDEVAAISVLVTRAFAGSPEAFTFREIRRADILSRSEYSAKQWCRMTATGRSSPPGITLRLIRTRPVTEGAGST